jgi:hypothetical protein
MTLQKGEKIVSENKVYEGVFQWPTKGENISNLFTLILVIFFWMLVFVEPSAAPLPISFTILLAGAFFLGRKIRKSSFANVYNDRVETGSTFFRVRMSRIEASKIESVTFGQAVLGKSNYGNVTIGGSGGMKLRIQNLCDPEGFVNAVNSISSAPVKKITEGTPTSSAQEITELNALLQSGIISQEEFEKGKKKALEK